MFSLYIFFFFQAEDGIRDLIVTGVQTCALPIFPTLSVIQWISTLSYEIYLYHPFFMRSSATSMIGNVASPVALLYAVAATLLMAAVARMVINIIIESATRRGPVFEKWDATI